MNKKILLSSGILVFAVAALLSATGAFFNDTETSTGNTFTAGAIDLKVDSTQHYNGNVCTLIPAGNDTPAHYAWVGESLFPVAGTPCDGTWTLTDLGPTNHFFNFTDVKPGDQGEDTVSLHIDSNPAWACANITTTSNEENTNLEPEITAGDTTVGPGQGELASNIHFQAWLDQGSVAGFSGDDSGEGDNIWQVGEPALASGALSDIVGDGLNLTLADGGTGTPLPPTATDYIGMFWCAGTVTGGAGNLGCDGSSMGNTTMTDSVTADVTFRVEQSRNNPNFRCDDEEVVAPIVVGANDLESNILNAATSQKWYFYDDKNDVLNNSLGGFVAGPAVPPQGTGSAVVNPLADATSRTLLTNSQFGGTLLSNISALSFSYYQPAGAWSVNEAPFLRFNVDFNNIAAYQNSLVYVPVNNGPVTQGSWQSTGNMASAGANWTYSGANWPVGVNTAVPFPGTTLRTWASILADYPNIKMHATYPQIGMRVGEPGPAALTANLDNFSITISAVTKTYDFGN